MISVVLGRFSYLLGNTNTLPVAVSTSNLLCKMEQMAGSGGAADGAQGQQYRYHAPPPPPLGQEAKEAGRTIVNNPGNVVATCGYPSRTYLPYMAHVPVETADWFEGYTGKPQHPMYTTSAASYGAKPPTVHTVPTQFYARSQKFSEHLGTCGMYRNFSLNTDVDKSKV